MSDEIAQLQAELAAAAVTKKSKALHLKRNSAEFKLVSETIKEYIDDLDRLRRTHAPLVERIEKAITMYRYIMANPNIVAAVQNLRANSVAKANEFLNEPFERFSSQENFAANRAQLRASMQNFLTWVQETLSHNVYYEP